MYKSTKNPKLTHISRVLRSNMTPEENHLWYDFLKKLPQTIHRQKVIGNFVADFYIASPKIVIEIDGKDHYKPEHAAADRIRDAYFEGLGILVLRFSNRQVNEAFVQVCRDIESNIQIRSI